MIRVLHVVATDQRRGAEIFASQLVRSLERPDTRHAVAIIHASPSAAIRFDAPSVMLSTGERGRATSSGIRRRLRAAIRDFRPAVLQAHGGEALKFAMVSSPGVPIVYRRIGDAPPWLLHGPRRWMWGAMMRRAAAVVTVADALRDETTVVFRVPASRVRTIPNAVDPCALQPRRMRSAVRASIDVADDAAVTISVGALVREKDPVGTVALIAPVLRRHPGATHLFVGDGPLRAAVCERIRSESLDGSIRMLGVRDDVGDLLRASDVLLFASPAHAMEGMPATLIEAGLCGLPVVAYATAGAGEVVDDGVTGTLVRPGDVEAARAGVERLLDDDGSRARMGAAAAERCRVFEIDRIAERYLSLYREVARA